jgi:hypothetical protein
LENESFSSWPGLTRPSTSFIEIERKTWMPGTRPGMTSFEESARYNWLLYESDSLDEGIERAATAIFRAFQRLRRSKILDF